MSRERIRLAVLVSHPIQYFVPVYRELARRDDISLSVIFHTRVGVDSYYDPGFGKVVQWDIPLLDGYQSTFLSSRTQLGGVQWKIVSELFRHAP